MPLKLTYRLKSESIVRWFLDREIENKSRERERGEREQSRFVIQFRRHFGFGDSGRLKVQRELGSRTSSTNKERIIVPINKRL